MDFIRKTFGGLSTAYYIRQFIFGLPILALVVWPMFAKGGASINVPLLVWGVIFQFLYPYSRFVYESVVGYLMGNNVFFVNAFLMLITKLFTMLLCWFLSIFIAPVGLLYLYFYHSKQERQAGVDE